MLQHLDLFSGISGFSLAAQMVGSIQTTQFVEIDPYCQRVLAKNFRDIPIWADICDYHPFPGQFDLYTLGYPCQGNSRANISGQGLADPRSGLWFEALRCIHEGQPSFVVIENVPPTVNRNWLRTVLEGLDQAGFDAEWEIVTAAEVGAPHLRERLFIVAYSRCNRLQGQSPVEVESGRTSARRGIEASPAADSVSVTQRQYQGGFQTNSGSGYQATRPNTQPGSLGVDDGVPDWLDGVTYSGWWAENRPPMNAGVAPRSVPNRGQRIHACGNSVVPGVAAIALGRVLQLAKGRGLP